MYVIHSKLTMRSRARLFFTDVNEPKRRFVTKNPQDDHGTYFWRIKVKPLETVRLVVACSLILAFPFSAIAASEDLLVESATCGGRLSAQIAHERLIGSPKLSGSMKTRSALFALMKAVSTDSTVPQAHDIWIGSRKAHSALLKRAAFPRNKADGELAAKRATQLVTHCRGLVQGFLDAQKNDSRIGGVLTGAIGTTGNGGRATKSYRFFSSFPN